MAKEVSPNEAEKATGAKSQFATFVSSSAGRVVVIAIALGVLLVVAGIAAVVVLNFTSSGTGTGTPVAQVPPASKPATSTPEEASATVAPPVPDSAVFKFRDIFQKVVRKVETTPAASDETTGSTETSSTADLDPQTLYLQDIVTENDTPKAVLAFNAQTYTLAKGETISGTPWEVLEVRSGSVTMLYGDSQVVLSVGQGMQQK